MSAKIVVDKLLNDVFLSPVRLAEDNPLDVGKHIINGAYYTVTDASMRTDSQMVPSEYHTDKPILWVNLDTFYVPPKLRGRGYVQRMLAALTAAADSENAALEVAIAPSMKIPKAVRDNFKQAFIAAGFKAEDEDWYYYVRMPRKLRFT